MSQKKKKSGKTKKPNKSVAPSLNEDTMDEGKSNGIWHHWPWALLLLAILYIVGGLMPPKAKTDLDYVAFGKLPILKGGRTKPLDSLARNSLRKISEREVVPLEGNAPDGSWGDLDKLKDTNDEGVYYRRWYQFNKRPKKLEATQWLMEVLFDPDKADKRFIFRVDHPDLAGEFNLHQKGVDLSGIQFFSFNQLREHLSKLESRSKAIAQIKQEQRDPHEKATIKLAGALHGYLQLRTGILPNFPGLQSTMQEDLEKLKSLAPGIKEANLKAVNEEEPDGGQREEFQQVIRPYAIMAQDGMTSDNSGNLLIIPLLDAGKESGDWHKLGDNVISSIRDYFREEGNATKPLEFHPVVEFYGKLDTAFSQNNADKFNTVVDDYGRWLTDHNLGSEIKKTSQENYYNHFAPFGKSKRLYVIALIFACLSWLNLSRGLGNAAFYLVGLALVVHTTGIIFRMWLEGRPPVTNLYSSALFIGWGSVLLGWVLERFYRNGIGSSVAAMIGFCTLLIADQLAMGSDTMEMMRAVLDTNFWLATHVVAITLGYAATFLAGFLALVYVLRGTLTSSLTTENGQSIARMIYGIVCFATLFSFVGTVLGGIWADQSWGRFWGWDTKENGALLIVIWNAIILHCRWGGFIRDRGLAALAIFGNIVTAWSWFGVNMLGIGLHSYGFMDEAFNALKWFAISQMVIIVVGCLPLHYWASGKHLSGKTDKAA